MPAIIDAFRLYAVVGLLVSLGAHFASLLGYAPGGNALFFGLHIGIFPLWFFTILTTRPLFAGVKRRGDAWKIMFSGCPPWLQYLTRAFFYYALANFLFFFLTTLFTQHGKPPAGAPPPPSVWRGFSGHWMAFYCAGLAMLTTVRRIGWNRLARTCPRGHAVAWTDAFCPECGAKLPLAGRSP